MANFWSDSKPVGSEVDPIYPYTLLGITFLVWFAVGYLFGMFAWQTILSFILALALTCFSPIRKNRFLGALASIAVILLVVFVLFGWQTSPTIETTGHVVDKYTWISGSPSVSAAMHTRYEVQLSFDGEIKDVEVTESLYNSINRYDKVAICYHMEELGMGLMAHSVIEDIDSRRVIDGGGMKFGESGSYQIGGWILIIASGIPLIVILIGKYVQDVLSKHIIKP